MSILILGWPTLNGVGLRCKYHKRQAEPKTHVLTRQDSNGLLPIHMSEFLFFLLKWIVTNFVGKKCYIFTENLFSVDLIFGNFLFHFLGALHYFKMFIERKLKIKNPTTAYPYLYSISPPPNWAKYPQSVGCQVVEIDGHPIRFQLPICL